MGYNFVVAGLGASAGGLRALTDFFSSVRKDDPAAYIVVVHSHRDHKTQLPVIISRYTSVATVEIIQGMPVESGKIYFNPPAMNVSVRSGVFLLKRRLEHEVINHSIDYLFKSLAQDAKENAIGIIMSGTGSDGANGLNAIEKHRGTTIVQDPATAEFDGMPNNSIRFDHPDFILAPSDMPSAIARIIESKLNISVRR
jgi:chemotaxis response regulator CheB